MREEALKYLVCPSCQSDLAAELPEPHPDGHYMSGTLTCSGCGHAYPIVNGVPRMVVTAQEARGAAETFGFEWQKHGEKELEGVTVFGRSQEEDVAYFLNATRSTRNELKGAVILDAGCGSGQLTAGVGMLEPQAVIGIDVNTAIEFPFQRCRHLRNVHIVQADILSLPSRPHQFDLVWSNGVIHHTPNPPKTFVNLSRTVKPLGKLYVWVYERRQSPFVTTGRLLRTLGIRQRLSLRDLYRLSKALAIVSLFFHTIYRAIRWLPPLRPESFGTDKTTRYRSLGAFGLTWFDVLSPKYDESYTKSEIREWFTREGFVDLALYPDQIGVVGIRKLDDAPRTAPPVGASA
ncbi:methyltransferase domain-containing protein [Bradyrhizobium sp. CB1650]|uniref:methyltransferase domain-containing protein n=1 Tax=Bradyrhizobium sp. CB1650 TaxID=3039153 RepID=UPI0024357691|nr:methyltransferase domain-containing protein [Bradyrhizobium sp. CB1650]WGD55000.1 methyltransferase domain-containing protein [Bradyrhizobium sp. CB1650]